MRVPAGHPLHLVLGLALWFVWFCVLYGGAAVACALGPPAPALGSATGLNAGLMLITAATAAGLAWGAWRMARAVNNMAAGPTMARARFIASVSSALYVTAAASTLLVGLPALFLPPCV